MAKRAIAIPRPRRTAEKRVHLGYLRFMRRRDALRSGFSTPPPPEQHVSIAVLEAWADGRVDETDVMQQIAKCHRNGIKCARCLESLEYYRHRIGIC